MLIFQGERPRYVEKIRYCVKELLDQYQEMRQKNKVKDYLVTILFKIIKMLFLELRNKITLFIVCGVS